jgi:hypothetical protein
MGIAQNRQFDLGLHQDHQRTKYKWESGYIRFEKSNKRKKLSDSTNIHNVI